jgi:5-oxoprolinase (ATP-hydrolysing)
MRFRIATTRATNALLQRRHARVALVVTPGFADVLAIGDQRRPELFTLSVAKPPPITDLVVEAPGRIDAGGRELAPLDEPAAAAALASAKAAGAETVAIALMHAWINPSHERRVAALAREAGFGVVVASSEAAPRIHLLTRAQTACVDAALAPVLSGYLDEVRGALGGGPCHALTSAGGLVASGALRPADALLSGPAGGVVGATAAGALAGAGRLVSFDMGGTSTDVARIDGAPEPTPSHRVGDVDVARPAVDLHTVAAGGGSICDVRDGRPTVGPESAGADPGPACYGAGGPLTLTDANLLLGRIDDARFQIPIDPAASRAALGALLDRLPAGSPGRGDPDLFLAGLLDLANERMAEAIRRVSVRRGFDPRDHALVAFGGAGPQHACDVAARLGIGRVIVPGDASVLSAAGLEAARATRDAERQILRPLDAVSGSLPGVLDELERDAIARLEREEEGGGRVEASRLVSLRLAGQVESIELPADDAAALTRAFDARYVEIHGARPDLPIEVASARVVASVEPPATPAEPEAAAPRRARPSGVRRVHDGSGWIDAPTYDRASMAPGDELTGPALVLERRTAVWLPPGWTARQHADGRLDARADAPATRGATHALPSMARELAINRLAGIAEQMGEALRRAAVSTNIKERQDYSCGVLDPDGVLVSSAPHIPVHLGALGACARRVLEVVGPLSPGDVVVTNHPAFGGSHLPDVTTLQPAHAADGRLLGYVMSRAHHAEIGGRSPGSMPPDARSLAEEGVPIPPTSIARGGAIDWSALERLLTGHAFPSRSPADNLADLRSAVAAGRRAAAAVATLDADAGPGAIAGAMRWIVGHTAGLVRGAIDGIGGLPAGAVETLDDGAEIRVRIARTGLGLTIDFGGTSPTHPGNLNAPLAVTRSAVAYVLRLLIARGVPLNDGLLAPVEIVAPEGCMLNPVFEGDDARSPAVAGGNVETSQRVVEALLRALGLAAGSQGTMNNLLLGSDAFGYYETIGGGAGATRDAPGASGVHVHMTNTAITDPEALERRHPVRVERFELRRGSGGDGRRRGGEGLVRELTALEPLRATIVSQRRAAGAPGLDGGGDGAPGAQRVVRADGAVGRLGASDRVELGPGDRIVVETPGGGGCGAT